MFRQANFQCSSFIVSKRHVSHILFDSVGLENDVYVCVCTYMYVVGLGLAFMCIFICMCISINGMNVM
jgi:hypothetical protein